MTPLPFFMFLCVSGPESGIIAVELFFSLNLLPGRRIDPVQAVERAKRGWQKILLPLSDPKKQKDMRALKAKERIWHEQRFSLGWGSCSPSV